MSDVKQQLDRRAITVIGVLLCLVRAIDAETELVESETPPLVTEVQCSLACKLLQDWLR